MKLRHLLFGVLAGVAFVACTNDNEPAGVTPVKGGDEVAAAPMYMTVNFATSGAATRATAAEESAINSAAFIFFNADGSKQVAKPFVIAKDGNDAVKSTKYEGYSKKWEDTTKAVVVLENPTEIPTSLVVLVNADLKLVTGKGTVEDAEAALYDMSLSTLQKTAKDFSAIADGFVMSNAVYNDASGNPVIGTPVGSDNVKDNPSDAEANPVTVNVDRVLAKVSVKKADEVDIESGKEGVNIALLGWALVYENTQSYLIKNLATSYDGLADGFKWNDAANKRSYWATAAPYVTETDELGNITGPSWSGIANADDNFGDEVYTQENTKYFNVFYTPNIGENAVYPEGNPTAVIVAAQLQDNDGKALDVYRWANTLLAEDDIVTLLKNRVVKKFFTKNDAGEYIPVKAEDFTVDTDENLGHDYEVWKYLKTTTLTQVYYDVVKAEDGTVTAKSYDDTEAINTALKDLGEFVEYFKGGATYYFIPIKQFIGEQAENYGVVRNNFYQLTINSVTGLGTAVPEPGAPIIPDVPNNTDKDYYIGAKIEVLNWNLVEQDVTLGAPFDTTPATTTTGNGD